MATNINLTFKVFIPLFVVAAVREGIFDSCPAGFTVLLPHIPPESCWGVLGTHTYSWQCWSAWGTQRCPFFKGMAALCFNRCYASGSGEIRGTIQHWISHGSHWCQDFWSHHEHARKQHAGVSKGTVWVVPSLLLNVRVGGKTSPPIFMSRHKEMLSRPPEITFACSTVHHTAFESLT